MFQFLWGFVSVTIHSTHILIILSQLLSITHNKFCANIIPYRRNSMELKFYYCRHCGKVIVIVKDSGMPTICCGEEMQVLELSVTDGAFEKHIPVIKKLGNKVCVAVGSIPHPSLEEHYIEWILLQTDRGIQKKYLKPGQEPKAHFLLVPGEKITAAYEYCNLHKLWKSE